MSRSHILDEREQDPMKSEPAFSSATQGGILAAGQTVKTTLFVSNLHCSTCVARIEQILQALTPLAPAWISISIHSHSVTLHRVLDVSVDTIVRALEDEGFDVHSAFENDAVVELGGSCLPLPTRRDGDWPDNFDAAIRRWRRSWVLGMTRFPMGSALSHGLLQASADEGESSDLQRKLLHASHCSECKAEAAGFASSVDGDVLKSSGTDSSLHEVDSNSLYFRSDSRRAASGEELHVESEKNATEDIEVVIDSSPRLMTYQVELAIDGMSCSSCATAVTKAIEELPFVRLVNVAVLTNSATVTFDGEQHALRIVHAINGAGFEASIEALKEIGPEETLKRTQSKVKDVWKASYTIEGMTCSACVASITNALKQHSWVERVDVNLISNSATVVFHNKDHESAITQLIEDAGYDVTLLNIVSSSALGDFAQASREVQIHIKGMYCRHCPGRVVSVLKATYGDTVVILQEPSMANPITKIRYTPRQPALTIRQILATVKDTDPAISTEIYHPPTIEDRCRELHQRDRKRLLIRLALAVTAAIPAFIFGVVCMQLLPPHSTVRAFTDASMWAGNVSRADWALFILATPVYFFAADIFHRKSLKEIQTMWRRGSTTPLLQRFVRFGSMNMLMSLGTTVAFFSSVAELAMMAMQMPTAQHSSASSTYFDSVIFLTMFLLTGRFIEAYSKARTGDAVTALGKLRPSEALLQEAEGTTGRQLSVDLLDIDDIIMVPNGASPPFDGVVVAGSTTFDESSLTGESRLVEKTIGDRAFSGTVNRGDPISVRLTSTSGMSMLDQIINIVREGQTKRAPVERAADAITSHFVPFVVTIGIITWIVWLVLGFSGALPQSWLQGQTGGWPVWSLNFAIAVFVVACPCGIGLAAPTAMFVGGGIAATNGILAKGGGDAFQEASTLDCIVFDKTGTLTIGGEPIVTDYRQVVERDEDEVLGMIKRLEENSTHPVAKAIGSFCVRSAVKRFAAVHIEEIPGKGMLGRLEQGATSIGPKTTEVIIGNESLMSDYGVDIDHESHSAMQQWKAKGRSVVLCAVRTAPIVGEQADSRWMLFSLFAVSDTLRPEARSTIMALQTRGIDVWMLSGDNPTTAQAVAEMVGISRDHVIAGVLPDQKATKIQWLQKTVSPRKTVARRRQRQRATVAMVGDGINDSPALAAADVGIAIGSGSDVALSSADFILISSDLTALLTLIDLSRKVFRRVWFNFGWALVYNIVAMPVAAGAFYAVSSNGKHIRLDPVWASLAMALSSVSVVCSSLLLRSRIPGVGFRR